MAAEGEEVLRTVQTAASRDSSTPSDRARRGAPPTDVSHEIRRLEGP